MNYNETMAEWKRSGKYYPRLQTFNDCRRGGMDEYTAIAYVNKLFADLANNPRPIDSRPVLRCSSCGQTGHTGDYPFSTAPHSGRCDDCV